MFIEHFPEGSAECPLVLLHGCEPHVVGYLREQVGALAAARASRVAVHDLPGFQSIAGCRLFFAAAPYDGGISLSPEPRTFECQLRPISWWNVEGLLEPFTEPTSPSGFQWLDNHGRVRLLISTERTW